MLNLITGVTIIFVFAAFTAVLLRSVIRLRKLGMLSILSLLLRNKWLLSLLTMLFFVQFFINGVALIVGAGWAVTVTRYTIYAWLAYVWLYGLKEILRLWVLLNGDKPKSISQFMGHSKFFDELIERSIALSKNPTESTENVQGAAHAVTDSPWEGMLNDEEMFKDIFPSAIRNKIRRKFIGLAVQTVLFLIILALLL